MSLKSETRHETNIKQSEAHYCCEKFSNVIYHMLRSKLYYQLFPTKVYAKEEIPNASRLFYLVKCKNNYKAVLE